MTDAEDRQAQLLGRASRLLETLKGLDHSGIAAGESGARRQLVQAIQALGEAAPGSESAPDRRQRQHKVLAQLREAGMGERLGRLYFRGEHNRILPFRAAPHQRGLPGFDLVIAPDFSPVAGYHLILVAPGRVSAHVLEEPAQEREWQVIASHSVADDANLLAHIEALATGIS